MTVPENEQILKLLKALGWQFAQPERHTLKSDKLPHLVRLDLRVPSSGGQDMTMMTTLLPMGKKQDET